MFDMGLPLGLWVACEMHPSCQAIDQCDSCNRFVCRDAVVYVRQYGFCYAACCECASAMLSKESAAVGAGSAAEG